MSSQFPNLFRYAHDVSVMVRYYFLKNGEQVVWGPIFRRNLGEGEIEDFAALRTVLDSVFIVNEKKEKRVWTGTIGGYFAFVSFFRGLKRWCSLKTSF